MDSRLNVGAYIEIKRLLGADKTNTKYVCKIFNETLADYTNSISCRTVNKLNMINEN